MTDADRIADLQARLQERAQESKREWWASYLRGAAVFRGVPMADVRAAVHRWHRDHGLGDRSPMEQAGLGLELIRCGPTEDKLAGMLLFQEVLLPSGEPPYASLLPAFATLFEDGHLADWNSVDWFCVKVLGPLVERDGEPCARAVGEWRTGSTLWQRRAGAVAFVNLVGAGERFPGFTAMVLESCRVLVGDPERFSQTGAGWVLRELGVAAPEAVEGFVGDHLASMSREAVRSAVKNLPAERARRLLDEHG